MKSIKKFVPIICSAVMFTTAFAHNCQINEETQIPNNSHQVLVDFSSAPENCSSDFGPSGIVYHEGLQRLVVVSDKKGQIATLKVDGTGLECFTITDTDGNSLDDVDHEGVTYRWPDDDYIFIALENGGEDGVAYLRQVELQTVKLVNTWKIDFPGGVIDNQGLESVTFVADPQHPEGGTFYLGDQTADKVMGQCALPISSQGDTDQIYQCDLEIDPGLDEISGLDFQPYAVMGSQHGVLFISSDEDNTISAWSPSGEFLGWRQALPAFSEPGQEGHAIDCYHLYIAADDNDNSQKIHQFHLTHH